jgi:hypothetical protein
MKTINVYFNYASKTGSGHLVVPDDTDIETMIKSWIKQGYCKINFSNDRKWIWVNWANVVYCAYSD